MTCNTSFKALDDFAAHVFQELLEFEKLLADFQ